MKRFNLYPEVSEENKNPMKEGRKIRKKVFSKEKEKSVYNVKQFKPFDWKYAVHAIRI